VWRQLIEATPWGRTPRYLIRDRDRVYGGDFVPRAKAGGIETLLTPFRAPKANAVAERLVQRITFLRQERQQPVHLCGHHADGRAWTDGAISRDQTYSRTPARGELPEALIGERAEGTGVGGGAVLLQRLPERGVGHHAFPRTGWSDQHQRDVRPGQRSERVSLIGAWREWQAA